jgi:4-alpha-glucanotransferase
VNGIQLGYQDVKGHRRAASRGAVIGALRALGVPLDRASDARAALLAHRRESWERRLEPVTVAWEGELRSVRLRLPSKLAGRAIRFEVQLEGARGPAQTWTADSGNPRRLLDAADVGGVPHFELELPGLGAALPLGYHRLSVEVGAEVHSSLLICAPRRAYPAVGGPAWGAFLPLYALRGEVDWGTGTLTDLGAFAEWVAGLGGNMVATLPLLAAFLDQPFEPSPYSPASRLFWNELYIDPLAAPELRTSSEARDLISSPAFVEETKALEDAPLLDPRTAMAVKRQILSRLSESFFATGRAGERWGDFQAFLRSTPEADDYARFRAAGERHRRPWTLWPAAERRGPGPAVGGDEEATRYHLYVQWLAAEQIAGAADRAHAAGAGLYFDMPLGVNATSYDVWRNRDAFALSASAGAPPDAFFGGGQSWGFPPLHPERIREQGYAYAIAGLRHAMRHASVLRLDHVMGFHRLYWVPEGREPSDGVYVKYRAEEWYAILALESLRSGTVVVGEDLGTVPSYVRQAMGRHGVLRTWVLPFDLHVRKVERRPPAGSLASLNTHDMPSFATSWLARGKSLTTLFRRSGLLTPGEGPVPPKPALTAALDYLATSDAQIVLVNLEDVWLEREPQNVPGTTTENPNWRRRARYPFEQFRDMPSVTGTLKRIDRLRKRGS